MSQIFYEKIEFSREENQIFSGAVMFGAQEEDFQRYRIMPFGRHYLTVILDGRVLFDQNGKKQEIPKYSFCGCFLKHYSIEVTPKWRVLTLALRPEALHHNMGLDLGQIGLTFREMVKVIPSLEEKLSSLDLQNWQLEEIVDRITTLIAVHYNEADFSLDIETLIAYFSQTNSISSLCEGLNMSRSTFDRIFSKTMGVPPGKYFQLLRTFNALHLLNNDGLTVSDVAYQLGFTDHSHLIKQIKKHLGVSPNEFLQSSEFLIKEALVQTPRAFNGMDFK